eukprot:scaffold10546_cov266-Chaetoceros_neogracile.AAC.18
MHADSRGLLPASISLCLLSTTSERIEYKKPMTSDLILLSIQQDVLVNKLVDKCKKISLEFFVKITNSSEIPGLGFTFAMEDSRNGSNSHISNNKKGSSNRLQGHWFFDSELS